MSMYQQSIPVITRALTNMMAVLDKGAAHASAKNTPDANYLGLRLAPDMFPLSAQLQIASDVAKGCAARLAGVEVQAFPDAEATFADSKARIANIIDYLASFKPEQIDGSEERDIMLKSPRGELHFKGLAYLHGFVMPNVYFHSSMTYALLRAAGVEIGKQDFLGAM